MKKRMSAGLVLALALIGYVLVARASPPSGVTPTLLARGTYGEFKVKSDKSQPFEFEAEAEPAVDIVVRRHDYAVNSTTGWHTHPGPVFITVTDGELTVYEWDDPHCTKRTLQKGDGYVDTGRGHMVRNESGAAAQDMTVIIAPVGGSFRGELDAPNPRCGF